MPTVGSQSYQNQSGSLRSRHWLLCAIETEEIAQIQGVSLVLGANEKFNIVEHLEERDAQASAATVKYDHIKQTNSFIPSHSMGDRTRSFLKVQDGCDYFCTFCTIPLARGKSRNASVAETLLEAEKIAQTAVKEVVLTGVNIGDFGQDGEKISSVGKRT